MAQFGRGERGSFTTISYDQAPRQSTSPARGSSTASVAPGDSTSTDTRTTATPQPTPTPTPEPLDPDTTTTDSIDLSEAAPTAQRIRARKNVQIRQNAGTEGEDDVGEEEIPADPTYGLTVAELVNAASVTQAQVAASSAAQPTALFYETTINGQVTTLQTPIPADASIVSTETMADPTTERTASLTQTELDPFAALPVETGLPTMTIEELGTAGVVTSMPTASTGDSSGSETGAGFERVAQDSVVILLLMMVAAMTVLL